MRLRAAVTVAASLLLALLALVVARPAVADTSVPLQLSGFRDLAIDPAHGDDPGHLIVSGWNPAYGGAGTQTGVVVTGLDGSDPVTVGTLAHAEGLATAPDGSLVYAALDDGDAIAAFAPTDPQNITTYPTGDSTCPHDVAVAGDGKVWFTYGCNTASIDLGVLDPSDGAVTLGLATGLFGRVLSGGALLANSPAAPNSIVIGERAAPGILDVLTVSDTTATVATSGSVNFAVDIEVAPDGLSFLLVASNSNATVHRLSMTDLSDEGSYTRTDGPYGDSYTSAAADSGDGAYVAAGGYLDNSVTTFGPGSSEPIRTYLFGSDANVEAGHAIAWIGTTLVVVTTDAFTRAPTLHFLTGALQAPTSITLSGSSTATRAAALTLNGTLVSRGDPVTSAALTVTKHDMDGDHDLGTVDTDGSGNFTVQDTPTVGGTVEYTVAYAGDDTHQGAQQSFTVTVSRTTPTLTVTPNKSIYDYGASESVVVHLGTTFSDRTVSIYAKQAGGTLMLIKSGSVNSSGNLSASVSYIHNLTFTAKYAGDEHDAPRAVSASRKVRVVVKSQLAGSYAKSGGYYLFHQSKGGGIGAKVFPNKAGEGVTFRLQWKRNGAWGTVATDVQYLNQYSVVGDGFDGKTFTPFRLRAEFHGDYSNAAGNGTWWYVQFR